MTLPRTYNGFVAYVYKLPHVLLFSASTRYPYNNSGRVHHATLTSSNLEKKSL